MLVEWKDPCYERIAIGSVDEDIWKSFEPKEEYICLGIDKGYPCVNCPSFLATVCLFNILKKESGHLSVRFGMLNFDLSQLPVMSNGLARAARHSA